MSSWMYDLCLFKWVFEAKEALQASHLNGFFFSRSASMCLLKCPLLESIASQTLHLNFVSWSKWILAMCCFKFPFKENEMSHSMHLKGWFPSWTEDYVFSNRCFLQKWLYKFHIWMASYPHEHMKYALLDVLLMIVLNHRYHIWKVSFLYPRYVPSQIPFLTKGSESLGIYCR